MYDEFDSGSMEDMNDVDLPYDYRMAYIRCLIDEPKDEEGKTRFDRAAALINEHMNIGDADGVFDGNWLNDDDQWVEIGQADTGEDDLLTGLAIKLTAHVFNPALQPVDPGPIAVAAKAHLDALHAEIQVVYDHLADNPERMEDPGFANPGANSALRAETPWNPRDRPCPNCRTESVLTRYDEFLGYQCDYCADRAEGRF